MYIKPKEIPYLGDIAPAHATEIVARLISAIWFWWMVWTILKLYQSLC